jgi:hypothetical protein
MVEKSKTSKNRSKADLIEAGLEIGGPIAKALNSGAAVPFVSWMG